MKKERKAEKAAAHEEKVRREKGKMRREIEKRLEELKAELGEEALEGLDLEGDWDEARHDRAMQELMAAEQDVSRLEFNRAACRSDDCTAER